VENQNKITEKKEETFVYVLHNDLGIVRAYTNEQRAQEDFDLIQEYAMSPSEWHLTKTILIENKGD
jgi:hypothetical protein